MRRLLMATLAIAAVLTGLWHLADASSGLDVVRTRVGSTPVTLFRPKGENPAPLVVIAHGFAGSQELMLPFALTLARNGYLAVTFDFPGHGRNPRPLVGGLADDATHNRDLLETLAAVTTFARSLPGTDGRLAVLGHSMASDTAVQYATEHPDVQATIAVSLFARAVTATAPRNLLVIDGALEPAMLTDEGLRVVGLVAKGPVRERVTYGSFTDGTARRLALAGGVEHIGVLYSAQSQREALSWLNQTFERHGAGFIDAPGPWLGLLFVGLVALGWPLASLLPRLVPTPLGAGLRWRRQWPVVVLPAILTPLITWKLPTDFLPILLGDYLAVHFAVYGLLTALGLWFAGVRFRFASAGWTFVAAVLAVAAYNIFAIGVPIDRFATSFLPSGGRWILILAMLGGTLPYFVADEWLTRGPDAARFGYAFSKICFVVSLALAVTLNPPRLFSLIIIIPVILIFLGIYGLFSTWAYRRTRNPMVGGLANALAFAWAIAVTFPAMGR